MTALLSITRIKIASKKIHYAIGKEKNRIEYFQKGTRRSPNRGSGDFAVAVYGCVACWSLLFVVAVVVVVVNHCLVVVSVAARPVRLLVGRLLFLSLW